MPMHTSVDRLTHALLLALTAPKGYDQDADNLAQYFALGLSPRLAVPEVS